MFRLDEDWVKIDRYVLIGTQIRGLVKICNSIYLNVPMQVLEKMKRAGLDLKRDKLDKYCTLAVENDGEHQVIRLIYEFHRPKEANASASASAGVNVNGEV